MDAEAFLRRAWNTEGQVRALEMQIRRLRERLGAIRSSSPTGMPRGGGGRWDWTDAVAALEGEEAELSARIPELYRVRHEVRAVIERVPDKGHRELLELRFLCYMTWERVADTMMREQRQMYRMRRSAIEAVQAVLDGMEDGDVIQTA